MMALNPRELLISLFQSSYLLSSSLKEEKIFNMLSLLLEDSYEFVSSATVEVTSGDGDYSH